jgi:hypothetical protein
MFEFSISWFRRMKFLRNGVATLTEPHVVSTAEPDCACRLPSGPRDRGCGEGQHFRVITLFFQVGMNPVAEAACFETDHGRELRLKFCETFGRK